MNRTAAVARILEEIGFRPAGTSLDTTIINRLKEAQRDLEHGKTLPRFLLQQDQTLSLVAGDHSVALPPGFLRDTDDGIRFYTVPGGKPQFLSRVYYKDGIEASWYVSETDPDTPARTMAPKRYVIRNATIDFITVANANYTLYWDYYKADAVLDSDDENLWLANASDWLIGEAGSRLTAIGNSQAMNAFAALKQSGRAAVFGDDLALETGGGPLVMGSNN